MAIPVPWMLLGLALMPAPEARFTPDLLVEAHKKGCQAVDLAKWVQQAVLGPGHLLNDPVRARSALEREWREIESDQGLLWEFLGPRKAPDTVARVHLRVWKARGGNVDAIWDAMVRTAQRRQADNARLRNGWNEVLALAQRGLIPQTREALSRLTDDLCGSRIVFRHSPSYHVHQKPAYRVLNPAFLNEGGEDPEGAAPDAQEE